MHGPSGTVSSPSTQSPELLRPGKGTKSTAHLGVCPCRAPENLSGLDWEVHKMYDARGTVPLQRTLKTEQCRPLGCGKPSVVHPLQTLPMHASGTCLQCPSLPTT